MSELGVLKMLEGEQATVIVDIKGMKLRYPVVATCHPGRKHQARGLSERHAVALVLALLVDLLPVELE